MKADRRQFLGHCVQVAAALPLIQSMGSSALFAAANSTPPASACMSTAPRTRSIARSTVFSPSTWDAASMRGSTRRDSPLSDADGFRKDVLQALRELDVPTIRWPGGFFATYYHWLDGVGPKALAPEEAQRSLEAN